VDSGIYCSADYSALCDLTHVGWPPPGLFNPSAKLRKTSTSMKKQVCIWAQQSWVNKLQIRQWLNWRDNKEEM